MTPPALLLSAALALALAGPAAAQSWPSRPITMVATFPAGGPTDGVARVLAHELGERLKQKVVVENRGGAGGTSARRRSRNRAPDGHTLLLTSTGPLGYYRALYKSLAYDPVKDFAPVALIGTIPQVIIVSPKLKAATLKEFIAYAARESRQGQYRRLAASAPRCTSWRRRWRCMTGIEIQHVHYRGAAGSVADVLGGQIEAALSGFVPSLRDHEGPGRHLDRAAQGAAQGADVPRERARHRVGTLADARRAGRHAARRSIARLNAATNDFLKSERGKVFETNYSLQIAGGTPEAAREFLAGETRRGSSR